MSVDHLSLLCVLDALARVLTGSIHKIKGITYVEMSTQLFGLLCANSF